MTTSYQIEKRLFRRLSSLTAMVNCFDILFLWETFFGCMLCKRVALIVNCLLVEIYKIFVQIKDEKRKEYDDKNKNSSVNEYTTIDDQFSTPQILIDELFKLSKAGKISDDDITEQVNTMIVGVSLFTTSEFNRSLK